MQLMLDTGLSNKCQVNDLKFTFSLWLSIVLTLVLEESGLCVVNKHDDK